VKVLVTGAAGFIGSVVTEVLLEAGHQVVGLDNLSKGHRGAVHPEAALIEADLRDEAALRKIVGDGGFDAVAHLAAEAAIDDSVRDPGKYYRTNVTGGLNLLDAMVQAGVGRLVFSSTAAVYGEPATCPVTEDHPLRPVNSYGESKLVFERALEWYRTAHGIRSVSFRYFNACGATERYGESRERETHLIPVLFEAALGQREAVCLFGTDYDTPDGTCLRDYVHVVDIARAHVLALTHLDRIQACAFNLGSGSGSTNIEVIETVREVTGKEIRVTPAARRPGDPARLVAGSDRARAELGWEPRFPDLQSMVRSAWAWRLRHPQGYRA
jgi:UDP-glucose 4-epimerase